MMKRSAIALRLPKWSKLKILSWVSRFFNFLTALRQDSQSRGFLRNIILKWNVSLLNKNRNVCCWWLRNSFALSAISNATKPARKRSGALWRRGGKMKESLQLRLWNFNSTSKSRVAPRRLCCQISANRREAERSANVNKHWKARVKGNDVITNVISANQHVASTFSMQIFKFQRRSCKFSFLFPHRRQSTPKSLLAG